MPIEHLIVAGTGIRAADQITLETIAWIQRMDKVLYIVSDRATEQFIQSLNREGAESLMWVYNKHTLRTHAYETMIATALLHLRNGRRVCFVTYGHPGVFVQPTHELIRRARAEGFVARMLPAVSAEACMIADLGIDMHGGVQSFEAGEFLSSGRRPDPLSHVVLWQIGGLGDPTGKYQYRVDSLFQLSNVLMALYPPLHVVYLYEAGIAHGVPPSIRPGYLMHLPHVPIPPNSTLYIPPMRSGL